MARTFPENCTHTRHVVVLGQGDVIYCIGGSPLSVTIEPGERIISGGVYRPGQDDAIDPPNLNLETAGRPEPETADDPYVRRFKRPPSQLDPVPVEPAPEPEPEPEPEPAPEPVDPYEPEPVDPTPLPEELPPPPPPDTGFVLPTIDEFMYSLAENGEGAKNLPNDGWTAQNGTTHAYGRWQCMPLSWRDWSSRALDIPYDSTVANKATPATGWVPTIRGDWAEGRANQTTVVKWRVQRLWNQTNDWQKVAAAWFSGDTNPAKWSERTIRYVNRVCVPLGYAALPLPV